jgi:hypothetical protein
MNVGMGPGMAEVTSCVENTVLQTHTGKGFGGGGTGVTYAGTSTQLEKVPTE